jgi:hypothetical protein
MATATLKSAIGRIPAAPRYNDHGSRRKTMRRLLPALLLLTALLSPSAAHAQVPDLSEYVGIWAKHGFALDVRSDGFARASWRTYQPCPPGLTFAPCDATVGGLILDGGRAEMVFTEVAPGRARGVVPWTTGPNIVGYGMIELVLREYGMADLSQGLQPIRLCGPRFTALAPPEVQAGTPCGA